MQCGEKKLSPPAQVPQDQKGTAAQQEQQDEDGAVAEKHLGQHEDDLIGRGIEKPVHFSGKEKPVEEDKSSVEIQRGQRADGGEGAGQKAAGPEVGAPAQGLCRQDAALFQSAAQQQRQEGEQKNGEVQAEQHGAVGKMPHSFLGPAQNARAEGSAEQAEIEHLIVSAADLLGGPARFAGEIQQENVGVVKGPQQNGHGDGGRQHEQHGGGSQQDKERETFFHNGLLRRTENTIRTWEGR